MKQKFFIDVARWNGRFIDLKKIERSELETIYHASKNNETVCIHCRKPVLLHIGIDERPRFLHEPTALPCEQKARQWQEKNAARQMNGFILPKNVPIFPEGNWKEPYRYTKIPPFVSQKAANKARGDSFYKHLEQIGFPLDDEQWKCVTHTEGPLLILAGAGSGKTRVLTARTYYMLTEKQIPAKKMLLVTFTAKAAKEMRERMKRFPRLNEHVLNELLIGTFHSIFFKMLSFHQPKRWQKESLLSSDALKVQMLKQIGKQLELDENDFAYELALNQISWWKNNFIQPNDIIDTDEFTKQAKQLYAGYEQLKQKFQYFDFDDMLVGCYQMLCEYPALLNKYQERFQYISIDEFQDINKVQYEIIQMFAKKHKNLCVVGDDDQAIYSFRGSDPHYILNFSNDYQNATTVVLKNNYRSHHAIVSFAKSIIKKNRRRYEKNITAIRESGNYPLLFYPYDEEQEATMITNDIKKRLAAGVSPENIAILYRTQNNIRALFERFIEEKIPFSLALDGPSFYERNIVKKVLAFLQFSINPNDNNALEEVLTALFFKRETIQELMTLCILENISFNDALFNSTKVPNFQKEKWLKIIPRFAELSKMNPKEAISFIYENMGLKQYVKKRENETTFAGHANNDIYDLLVLAQRFPTLESFVSHAKKMTAHYEKMKKQNHDLINAVQMMTIHRSKGLEFDHVYIIGAVEGNMPHEYALEALKKGDEAPLEEERRLMYVAVTRAKQTAKISVPTYYRSKRATISRFLPK